MNRIKAAKVAPVLGYVRLDDGEIHLPAEELAINAQWFVNRFGGDLVRVRILLESDYQSMLRELRAGRGKR